jgi:hypothetical protein
VKEFARRDGAITALLQGLRQRDHILEGRNLPEPLVVVVDAGLAGREAREQRCARGAAEGSGTLRVGEINPAGRQPVQIWGLHLRMAAEISHPVIQIVDGYKEHVRSHWRRLQAARAEAEQEEETDDFDQVLFHV